MSSKIIQIEKKFNDNKYESLKDLNFENKLSLLGDVYLKSLEIEDKFHEFLPYISEDKSKEIGIFEILKIIKQNFILIEDYQNEMKFMKEKIKNYEENNKAKEKDYENELNEKTGKLLIENKKFKSKLLKYKKKYKINLKINKETLSNKKNEISSENNATNDKDLDNNQNSYLLLNTSANFQKNNEIVLSVFNFYIKKN